MESDQVVDRLSQVMGYPHARRYPMTLEEANVRRVEVIEVIRVTFLRGGGEDHKSPVREVVQYWTKEGERLVEIDHFAPEKTAPDGR